MSGSLLRTNCLQSPRVPLRAGQPLRHPSGATDPFLKLPTQIFNCHYKKKLHLAYRDRLQHLLTSICTSQLHLERPFCFASSCLAQGQTDRRTLARHPGSPGDRQEAGQTWRCCGSVEGYAWSCRELNIGVRTVANLSASVLQNVDEVCHQLRLGRYATLFFCINTI